MSKKDKIDESFISDLAKNAAVYLTVSALKRKKSNLNDDPVMKQMFNDLSDKIDKIEKQASKRISQMSPEQQKVIAKVLKQAK